jgi:hypothetical protein
MDRGGWRENGLWYGPLALMNLMRREPGPVTQAGMRRAVGAGQEDCPLKTSATHTLDVAATSKMAGDVAATSHLVREAAILAGCGQYRHGGWRGGGRRPPCPGRDLPGWIGGHEPLKKGRKQHKITDKNR